MEPLQEDSDEDLTPVDESKVLCEKGGPPPEPLPTQVDQSALGLVKKKEITAGERPRFMDLGRLSSSMFAHYEARRLRSWNKEKVSELGSDDEDQVHTSNHFAALEMSPLAQGNS